MSDIGIITNEAQRYGVHIDPERSRVERIDDELMQDNSYRIVIQFALRGSEE